MTKNIVALSMLLFVSAAHGAASQQSEPIGTGVLSLAASRIFDPSNGDQACFAIKELWEKMKKVDVEAGCVFVRQALLKDLTDGNQRCFMRKKNFTRDQGIQYRPITLGDETLVESSKEMARKFKLLQAMMKANEICFDVSHLMEGARLDIQTCSPMLAACDITKELCAAIEENTQNGYRIDHKRREHFIGEVGALARDYQKFKRAMHPAYNPRRKD